MTSPIASSSEAQLPQVEVTQFEALVPQRRAWGPEVVFLKVLYPIMSFVLGLLGLFYLAPNPTSVLSAWSGIYIFFHSLRGVLLQKHYALHITSSESPPWLKKLSKVMNVLGWTVWVSGIVIVSRSQTEEHLRGFAIFLICLESFYRLAPACILFTLICCLPCFLYLSPRQEPATVQATAEEVISKIQRFFYREKESLNVTLPPSCSVCLTDYEPDDVILRLPCQGAHAFHATCVERWFSVSQLCPICRTNIAQIVINQNHQV